MSAPGLSSLNESRQRRKRQLATGKTSFSGIPPRLFLTGLLVLLVGGFVYFRLEQAELEQQRARVLAKQRAIAKELGPRLLPLRDAVERGAQLLAAEPPPGPQVEPGTDFEELFSQGGIYLRLRREEARDLKIVRRAAQESLRDAFTACLLRDPSARPASEGPDCRESKDCSPGELCSEFGACQRPSSPFNARLLYRALGVLSEQWIGEVRDAGTELALVAYERGLDSVTEVDIPLAVEVFQRARYAVVVLDEDPPGGLPAPLGEPGDETPALRVQRAPHDARVGVFAMPGGKPLALLRVRAAGALRDVGGARAPRSALSEAVRARQANSCGMALEVKQRLAAAGR
jgi:hypothetical protein